MVSKILIVVLMQLAVGSVLAEEKDCSAVTCPTEPKHYEEMGCEAVKKEGECCVESYKCPDLKARDGSKCYYKNEIFATSESLSKNLLEGTCNGACYCREGRDAEPASFTCAHIDCPEYFGYGSGSKDCIRQYNKESCCSVKSVCGDEVEKLATCEYDGETFREGQAIYPDGTCYKCFCSKNFNNETALEKNENCHKIDCGITLSNFDRIFDGCIPVYYKDDTCCPVQWRCPEDQDQKSKTTAKTTSKSSAKCQFGKLEFNVGESLEVDDDCKKCTCMTPPMLHCINSC